MNKYETWSSSDYCLRDTVHHDRESAAQASPHSCSHFCSQEAEDTQEVGGVTKSWSLSTVTQYLLWRSHLLKVPQPSKITLSAGKPRVQMHEPVGDTYNPNAAVSLTYKFPHEGKCTLLCDKCWRYIWFLWEVDFNFNGSFWTAFWKGGIILPQPCVITEFACIFAST